MMKCPKGRIVVNATALDSSGALSILYQFVENIPNDSFQWIIFVGINVCITCAQSNVEFIHIPNVKSRCSRVLWDFWGVKRWLVKNDIRPICSISLQNTGFNCGAHIPNYIYYHQSIPLMPWRWSFFIREQRLLWFYKNIYPFFIKFFLHSDTHVFVQLECIKKSFHNRFGVPLSNIHVISPTVRMPIAKHINKNVLLPLDEKVNLFYPATPFFYKNHSIILRAIEAVDCNVRLYLTVNEADISLTNGDKIVCLGRIEYDKVLSMYVSCDAMVYPSYIETYGLPLIEAASLGIPIIAADLPYAREVLKEYDGVKFVPYEDVTAWHDAIKNVRKGIRYKPLRIEYKSSWNLLFSIVECAIKKCSYVNL